VRWLRAAVRPWKDAAHVLDSKGQCRVGGQSRFAPTGRLGCRLAGTNSVPQRVSQFPGLSSRGRYVMARLEHTRLMAGQAEEALKFWRGFIRGPYHRLWDPRYEGCGFADHDHVKSFRPCRTLPAGACPSPRAVPTVTSGHWSQARWLIHGEARRLTRGEAAVRPGGAGRGGPCAAGECPHRRRIGGGKADTGASSRRN
jgi:hypothetical protein